MMEQLGVRKSPEAETKACLVLKSSVLMVPEAWLCVSLIFVWFRYSSFP